MLRFKRYNYFVYLLINNAFKGDTIMIFNKKEMTEEDIKHQFITTAIEDRGWERSKIAIDLG